jgi:hypothetical protein
MKNDLTTGAWQQDIGCPISITLLSTSDDQPTTWPSLEHSSYWVLAMKATKHAVDLEQSHCATQGAGARRQENRWGAQGRNWNIMDSVRESLRRRTQLEEQSRKQSIVADKQPLLRFHWEDKCTNITGLETRSGSTHNTALWGRGMHLLPRLSQIRNGMATSARQIICIIATYRRQNRGNRTLPWISAVYNLQTSPGIWDQHPGLCPTWNPDRSTWACSHRCKNATSVHALGV